MQSYRVVIKIYLPRHVSCCTVKKKKILEIKEELIIYLL